MQRDALFEVAPKMPCGHHLGDDFGPDRGKHVIDEFDAGSGDFLFEVFDDVGTHVRCLVARERVVVRQRTRSELVNHWWDSFVLVFCGDYEVSR